MKAVLFTIFRTTFSKLFRTVRFSALAVVFAALTATAQAQQVFKAEAFSKFELVSPPENFSHYPFANPQAPRLGRNVSGVTGGFNTLNAFYMDGAQPDALSGHYETLLIGDAMRPDVSYGFLAQSLEWPEDYSWVIFNLRQEARFSDGEPLDADDVVFSFEALKERGPLVYQTGYAKIANIEKLDTHRVKFTPTAEEANADFIEYVGTRQIIPQHWWQERDFNESFLDIPISSSAFQISKFEVNRFVESQYNPDYWGKDLPFNKGLGNYDIIREDYYADTGIMRQAALAGDIDIYSENQSKSWNTEYNDVTAINDGMLRKEEIENGAPASLAFLAFNLNRPKFQHQAVRRALNELYNFEYLNKQVFFNAYTRSQSLFPNSPDNSAQGLPEGRELEILEPYRDQLPAQVFEQVWSLPTTDGALYSRERLKEAVALFAQAGWNLGDDGKMSKDGEQFSLQILYTSEDFDKVYLPYQQILERIGIKVDLARIDSTSFMSRLTERDFDLASFGWSNGFFPSYEQRFRWHSEFADQARSWNLFAYQSPVVDALIEGLVAADNKQDLFAHARALDRVIKWDYPLIFTYYYGKTRLLSWDKFGRPDQKPPYSTGVISWWIEQDKEQRVNAYLNKD